MVNALAQFAEFLHALGTLRKAQCRSELRCRNPAPARLAPFAVALGAEVMASGPGSGTTPVHGPAAMALAAASGTEDDDTELATGRFILLHDPGIRGLGRRIPHRHLHPGPARARNGQ